MSSDLYTALAAPNKQEQLRWHNRSALLGAAWCAKALADLLQPPDAVASLRS